MEEPNESLEYTPTWIVAVICTVIVFISLCVERALHKLGKLLERKNQEALFQALQKLKEELMLLGFISLLLTVSQNLISKICISPHLVTHMLPCKLPTESSKGSEHNLIFYDSIINTRRLLSSGSASDHCQKEGKVQLLALESLHHLHIFIFVLAVVHVVFCVTTMLLGGARIRQWKTWEDNIRKRKDIQTLHHHEFFKRHNEGYWRKAAVVGWLIAFCKQFYGSVTESDYITLRQGFIKEHCPSHPGFNFHKYIVRTLEIDFKKVVGISQQLSIFYPLQLVPVALCCDLFAAEYCRVAHLLLAGFSTGHKHIIARLGQESGQKRSQEEQAVGMMMTGSKKVPEATTRVKPSDEFFWFNRPFLVLDLIHFILFQNAFEIAFFFWIWCTYGFDSCIMEKIAYIIPRLIMGVIVQVLCSYSTLPLYTLVTQMGSRFKEGMFNDMVKSSLMTWVDGTRGGDSAETKRTITHRMVKDPKQDAQIAEEAIIMMEKEETSTSTIELHSIVEAPSSSQGPNTFTNMP
ncbi:MLO-like protein 13 [Senna tora]|uniref:MLO-like protein n=1 Tax=Senna tora TaxID=362788 RepID=A0A834VYM0_9FABA|nr:MLO-like protein 13 [Senna tora]